MTSAHIRSLHMLLAAGTLNWSRDVVAAIYLWKWFGALRVRPAAPRVS